MKTSELLRMEAGMQRHGAIAATGVRPTGALARVRLAGLPGLAPDFPCRQSQASPPGLAEKPLGYDPGIGVPQKA